MNTLAQVVIPGSIASWAVWLIIVGAVVAIVYVILAKMGVPIPDVVVKVFVILAIRFLMQLGGIA